LSPLADINYCVCGLIKLMVCINESIRWISKNGLQTL